MTTPTSPPPSPGFVEHMQRLAWKQGVLGAISATTAILAQRLIVLVAALGGIGLTYMGLHDPDAYKLGALAIYAAGVFIPSIWLARG